MRYLLLLIIIFSFFTEVSARDIDTTINLSVKGCSIRIHKRYSDDSAAKSIFVSMSFMVTEEVVTEAEEKKIVRDKIIFELTFDEKCQIQPVTIKTKGKLESFNKLGEHYSTVLFEIFQDENLINLIMDENKKCGPLLISLPLEIL